MINPLSPLLFAVISDVLLRRLKRTIPDATARAYADDVGLVVEDLMKDLPRARVVFSRFGSISYQKDVIDRLNVCENLSNFGLVL